MGAKAKSEYISSAKKTRHRFGQRKLVLFKKMQELTTVCDVKACLIIDDGSKQDPVVWPRDQPDKVRELVDLYMSKGQNRPADNKSEDTPEVSVLRKYAAMLETKLKSINSRIDELKMRESSCTDENVDVGANQEGSRNKKQRVYFPKPIRMVLPPGYCYQRPAEQRNYEFDNDASDPSDSNEQNN